MRRGMYLHAVEGSWLSHSIWKTRLLIESEDDARRIRESGVAEVWIDLSRGLDTEPGTPVPQPQPLTSADVAAPAEPAAPQRARTSMTEELLRAWEIRDRARSVVTSIFQQARLGKSIDPEVCAPLVTEVVDSVHRNSDALVNLSRLKLADEYTYLHSVAVCALMVSLGRQLGFDDAQCHEVGMAGLMHDLGKAAMPIEIINKPGALSDAEFEIVRQHPVRGFEMLMAGGVTSEWVLKVCRNHHERMDGAGYPDRLCAGDLPLVVRMGAVCDVYDAITSNRPYKAGWDPAESIARMASWRGHLDPQVLKAFIRSLGIYPTGSLVRLTSGRLAVVVAQNPSRLTEPQVKVFFSTSSGTQLKPVGLDLADPNCAERITGRESPENWPFTNLEQLWLPDGQG